MPNLEPVWLRRAESDLFRLFDHLETFQEGLGDRFLQRVDSAVRLITSMPESGPRYSANIRRLVIRGQRYGIFYSLEGHRIVIQAVCDLTQSPEGIKRHLGLK